METKPHLGVLLRRACVLESGGCDCAEVEKGVAGSDEHHQFKDSALLDMLNAGDKVMFKAEKVNGASVVTKIQPVR